MADQPKPRETVLEFVQAIAIDPERSQLPVGQILAELANKIDAELAFRDAAIVDMARVLTIHHEAMAERIKLNSAGWPIDGKPRIIR